MTVTGDFVGDLNRKAGISNPAHMLEAAGAANLLAGTAGLELVGALNKAAGTTDLELDAVLRLVLAGDGGGGTPGGGGGDYLVFDSFARANGPLGTAETGQAWLSNSTWEIVSQQVQCAANGADFWNVAYVPAPDAYRVSAAVTVPTGANCLAGVALCAPADGTHVNAHINWENGATSIQFTWGHWWAHMNGGTRWTVPTITAGQVLSFTLTGDQATAYLDGVAVGTETIPAEFVPTVDVHAGLLTYHGYTGIPLFDNFKVEAL